MSTKVKERLKKMALEMSHEERLLLDSMLDKIALENGMILAKEERGCDVLIERISDAQLRKIVSGIKKKKKKKKKMEAIAQ